MTFVPFTLFRWRNVLQAIFSEPWIHLWPLCLCRHPDDEQQPDHQGNWCCQCLWVPQQVGGCVQWIVSKGQYVAWILWIDPFHLTSLPVASLTSGSRKKEAAAGSSGYEHQLCCRIGLSWYYEQEREDTRQRVFYSYNWASILVRGWYYTAEPPNKGHFRASHVVLCREVVLFSEVQNVLVLWE